MKVELISYSQQTEGCRCSGTTLLDQVAFCARVSNPSNQNNTETTEKLVRYLIKNKHWSPFEMVNICLEITTTRDIARQILRHRSFSFQEFSQRYANPTETLSWNTRRARMQDPKNRQNSTETSNHDIEMIWHDMQHGIIERSKAVYDWAISKGIAKEQARVVLPEGIIESRIYMNGTLRSWIHYIQLRSGNGTQKEHQEVAVACAKAIEKIFPMINEFVDQSTKGAPVAPAGGNVGIGFAVPSAMARAVTEQIVRHDDK